MTIGELSAMAPMEPREGSLANPWSGVLDGTLAQSLGFIPQMVTTWQAKRENAL